jgi:hypothetical protein
MADISTVASPPPSTAAARPTLTAFHEPLIQRSRTATSMLSARERPNCGAALERVLSAWAFSSPVTTSM